MAPAAVAAAGDSSDDIPSSLAQLAEALKVQAPKLAPCTVPSAPAEAVLQRLYRDQDCEKQLQAFRRSAAARGASVGNAEAAELHIDWEVDAVKCVKAPARVMLLDKQEAALRNLPRLIGRLTAQQAAKSADEAATADLVQCFLRANGHDLADVHRLQDTVSVAYAMYVIHKELRLAEVPGPPLRELLEKSLKSRGPAGAPEAVPVEKSSRLRPAPEAETSADAAGSSRAAKKKRKRK
mmetsp:Transcript_103977/g.171115  ORF Transcript_103977/g.171115 Transcript_103977/m.171115 type:complete len:238 (+) Transcript_103977:40-753(+)